MRPTSTFGWLVLAALTLAPHAAAQSSIADVLFVHAMPGAADASFLIDGTVRASASPGGTSEGYVALEAGTPTIEVDVAGVRAAVTGTELRAGFRHVVVLYRSEAGTPDLAVFFGLAGRVIADALARIRTVNLVPALSEVRTYLHESCAGPWRDAATAFGTAGRYTGWESSHNGPMTVCAGDAALAPTRERPTDRAETWLVNDRVLAVYVVAGPEGQPEVLFVDETP